MIDFRTDPTHYKHWKLDFDGPVATLSMDVDEGAGLAPGYELKLNSYDLGVDIELYDAVQRLRFEHPEVGAVVITSLKDRVFCAGANIRMLGKSSHIHKVNFCKFTNETRNAIEDATAHSGQTYLCAVNGTAAGGGYELALATDYIMLIDDGSASVSLPEIPLLAVLPGTGGLTRLVDKRKVRHDHADFFCTTEEGVRGKRAEQWRLVDEVVPKSKFRDVVRARALAAAQRSDRPQDVQGVTLTPPAREIGSDEIRYSHLRAHIDRDKGSVSVILDGPQSVPLQELDGIVAQGAEFWPLALVRELDDLILHLRTNEPELGTLVFQSRGDIALVQAYDQCLTANERHWFIREIILYWKRTLKRLDVTSRSIVALVEPDSCFAGTLLEIVLGADRSYMLDGEFEHGGGAAMVRLTPMNFGRLRAINGLTRLQSKYMEDLSAVEALRSVIGEDLSAPEAEEKRLVTFVPDDIDWEDEVRIAIEERTSFSPDALTGMEASLRFAGPETLESKIFGRLSTWQNWIFQRPNAVGEKGALQRYGTGLKAQYDRKRV
ncbi:MAG: 2,3-epoxybenzoyl-CoA dihydrolase [Gammaproteobacteria bacterium]|nr:2,3-epoxybenzoyl-CoA dihydrolase [Gammaproteobacteria bacterium]